VQKVIAKFLRLVARLKGLSTAYRSLMAFEATSASGDKTKSMTRRDPVLISTDTAMPLDTGFRRRPR
jgi:hypothetical protein